MMLLLAALTQGFVQDMLVTQENIEEPPDVILQDDIVKLGPHLPKPAVPEFLNIYSKLYLLKYILFSFFLKCLL